MSNEWFANWFDSKYYHILYHHRSNLEATDFVDNCIKIFDPKPNETLLDLACGKGRHSIAFAKRELDVTGVDLSAQSIDYAKKFEHENLHFFVHDMRQTFRLNYYQYICNLFTSFGYFDTLEDNQLAAKSISMGLKKNGKFLIDFVNKSFALKNIENNLYEEIERENIKFIIEREYTNNQFVKNIKIIDNEKTFHFKEKVNSFTFEEMLHLFENEGLTFLKSFGNYDASEYKQTQSPRMILLFQK